jgi:hypothetical protein
VRGGEVVDKGRGRPRREAEHVGGPCSSSTSSYAWSLDCCGWAPKASHASSSPRHPGGVARDRTDPATSLPEQSGPPPGRRCRASSLPNPARSSPRRPAPIRLLTCTGIGRHGCPCRNGWWASRENLNWQSHRRPSALAVRVPAIPSRPTKLSFHCRRRSHKVTPLSVRYLTEIDRSDETTAGLEPAHRPIRRRAGRLPGDFRPVPSRRGWRRSTRVTK